MSVGSSGIVQVNAEVHDGVVLSYLTLIDNKTGEVLVDPNRPNRPMRAVEVDTEAGKVRHFVYDAEGHVRSVGDEAETAWLEGLDIRLDWSEDTPQAFRDEWHGATYLDLMMDPSNG